MSKTALKGENQISISKRFCADDADITFRSEDNTIFRIHKDNLSACTEGFSPPERSTFEEIVPLAENASTLELLFQFIYPAPRIDLESVDFSILETLAEASEKYQVYSAMNICYIHMVNSLAKHPESLFVYAIKHGYREITAKVLPLMLAKPLDATVTKMPPNFIVPWVRYYEQWMRVSENALTSHRPIRGDSECDNCNSWNNRPAEKRVLDTCLEIAKGSSSLLSLESCFGRACCGPIKKWRELVEADINNIPDFIELMLREEMANSQNSSSAEVNTTKEVHPIVEADVVTTDDQFSSLDSDIIFKSADGVLFHIHEVNVKACAADLPLFYNAAPCAVVPLREDASTLRLLFQFMYPMRNPDIQSLDFDALKSLAMAAEKYKVHSAMNACKIYMKRILPSHASAVMAYAKKGSYSDIVSLAAPLLIDQPLGNMVADMPSHLVVPWILYHSRWERVAYESLSFYNAPLAKGAEGHQCYYRHHPHELVEQKMKIVVMLGKGVLHLRNLDGVFNIAVNGNCYYCAKRFSEWRSSIESGIQKIPSFSTFL